LCDERLSEIPENEQFSGSMLGYIDDVIGLQKNNDPHYGALTLIWFGFSRNLTRTSLSIVT
jgi:hypothetical protein